MTSNIELSIVMPCLNEEETLGTCIKKANQYLSENGVVGEVVVSDNGSTDNSIEIAKALGVKIVHVDQKGYGAAIIGGIQGASGKYLIIGDSDDSYDFLALEPFLKELRNGSDLVIGNRFKGGIEKGAMPFLHKYLGNPVLAFIGRVFFPNPARDFHCGLRGLSKEAFNSLNLKCEGMEFASEMIVKGTIKKLKISEVPTTLSPDGRSHQPHLRTWRDGWRHLRFLLMLAPSWLFVFPSMFAFIVSLIISVLAFNGVEVAPNIKLGLNSLLYGNLGMFCGVTIFVFGLVSNLHHRQVYDLPMKKTGKFIGSKYFLEIGILFGVLLMLIGLTITLSQFGIWKNIGYGELEPQIAMKYTIPSAFLLAFGIETVFFSFFLNIVKDRYGTNNT